MESLQTHFEEPQTACKQEKKAEEPQLRKSHTDGYELDELEKIVVEQSQALGIGMDFDLDI